MSGTTENEQPKNKSKSAHGNILFAFGVALALYTAWHVREELVLIYVSALFAVVLMPVVRSITSLRIGKWSPGRGLAIFLLLLAAAGAAALFFVFALPPVIRDLHEFALEMPTRGPQLLARIRQLPFSQRVNVAALNAKLQDFASNFATYLLYSIKNWASTLFKIITGVVLTVYFMMEGETAYRWLLSFFPVEQRQRLDVTLARAEVRMGKWLLGQGSLMLILGLSSTIVFVALKVRYAYALGVLMGLLNIIPIAGALVSVALAILVAAIDSWGRVLGVAIFYAIYSQVETSYLTPKIMRTSVDLAGLSVLIALLLGAALAGVIGAMVAVPTAVLVAVLLNEYAVKPESIIVEGKPPSEIR
ncbi:putative PurR-regulated permease PerM [Silvibacterium bohemicum]|uniref:Putative PurR-regulated permease PerM n=1 Tax=Silvibacterium bohemicum TaxID=1577686 RepID=A0A841JQ85_9BACT|nr:AI-2E family transporter [Silvibacterium bohemicum]MBB6143552.1 putative PurR-regulated permease PerM [Silvibacterium bohemicum]